MGKEALHNADFDGSSFFWKRGNIGAVLLHGFTATTVEVRSLAQSLYDAGYTVSGPLLPGHGTTPEDLNNTCWEEWVDAAEDCYQQVVAGCDQVFIMGESMGGLTALYLATLHPEAQGVLVYSPAAKLPLSWFDWMKVRLAAPFVLGSPKSGLTEDTKWQGYRVNPLRGILQLRQMQNMVLPHLTKIQMPILIVMGQHDKTIDLISGDLVYTKVSSRIKEKIMFEHSPHVVLLGPELDTITELTLDFMKRCLNH
jgi:carboxylesterase